MGLSLRGSTSGSIDINPPAVAGNNTITLPGDNGSANQFFRNSTIAGIVTYSSMVEDSSGNIGIGTDNPRVDLHLHDSSNTRIQFTDDSVGTAAGDGVIMGLNGEDDFFINNRETSKNLLFFTENSERLRITSDGNIGIGLTNPGEQLGINGRIRLQSGNAPYVNLANATDAGNAFDVDTTTTVASGSGLVRFYNNGVQKCRIEGDGSLQNATDSYGPLASDERLKQDIVDIGSQWDDIKNIRLTKFRFKNNPTGDLLLGPIAQELEQVCPGLITRRPAFEDEIADPSNDLVDGDEVLSFKSSILHMKAVGALQEAMERIETLETTNASQALTIAALDARLTALEGA